MKQKEMTWFEPQRIQHHEKWAKSGPLMDAKQLISSHDVIMSLGEKCEMRFIENRTCECSLHSFAFVKFIKYADSMRIFNVNIVIFKSGSVHRLSHVSNGGCCMPLAWMGERMTIGHTLKSFNAPHSFEMGKCIRVLLTESESFLNTLSHQSQNVVFITHVILFVSISLCLIRWILFRFVCTVELSHNNNIGICNVHILEPFRIERQTSTKMISKN